MLKIGVDIIVPLDELPPKGTDISDEDLELSVDKSMRWEERSLNEHLKDRKGYNVLSSPWWP